jgi:hypothetical protein
MQAALVDSLVWLGIFFCLSQSAMFSGLNLALLGISRLRLEVESHAGNPDAIKILALRQDVNYLLTTVLWGNVGINVLLTLLSNSVMAGLAAFLFSTVLITFFGEITPQAYFSRNAMRMGSLLSPVLRFYQVLLYPVARPSAWVLDRWLGREGINYFREKDFQTLIHKHIEAEGSDLGQLEGRGAINFLLLDDVKVSREGEVIHPDSIISLPIAHGKPVFPGMDSAEAIDFLERVNQSGKKWVTIVDDTGQPVLVLNANELLRHAMFDRDGLNPVSYCHRPIVVRDGEHLIGEVIPRLKVRASSSADDVIDDDLILLWGDEKRVITGADILGRLLRGIVLRDRI